MTIDRRVLGAAALLAAAVTATTTSSGSPAVAQTAPPSSVTIAGSFQSELGCPGDWQPECAAPRLTYDAGDDVWCADVDLPAGAWEYKAALNGTWTESYGRDGGSANILLTLGAADRPCASTTRTTRTGSPTTSTTASPPPPVSFQSELGCPGDWQPDCLRSWLQDVDGDGVATFETTELPAGGYEWKVALYEAWDENYGADGIANGANLAFTVAAAGDRVTFRWDSASNVPTRRGGQRLGPRGRRRAARHRAGAHAGDRRGRLLRDDRPLRRRPAGQQPRRERIRRPARARLRPDRQGLVPRRRPRRPAPAPRLPRATSVSPRCGSRRRSPTAGCRTRPPATTATGRSTTRRSIRTSARTTRCAPSSTTPTPRT